jgi:hypothetical protein
MRWVFACLVVLLLTALVPAVDAVNASKSDIPSFLVVGKTYANAQPRRFKVLELGPEGWIRVESLTRGTKPGPWWVNTKRMTWIREVEE